jgi:hypothetical protein
MEYACTASRLQDGGKNAGSRAKGGGRQMLLARSLARSFVCLRLDRSVCLRELGHVGLEVK